MELQKHTSESEEAGSPLVEGSAPGGVTGEYTFFSTDFVEETTDEAESGLLLKRDVSFEKKNPFLFFCLSISLIFLLQF